MYEEYYKSFPPFQRLGTKEDNPPPSNRILPLDFSTHRTPGSKFQRNAVFSAGLERQFENLPESESMDFEKFVRKRFIYGSKTVYVSYPNFKRVPRANNNGSKHYNNLAIRFTRDKENDLVLLGDIFEDNRGIRTFSVKAILSMDPNIKHYGERQVLCNTAICLNEHKWEGIQDSYADSYAKIKEYGVLTDDFMLRMNDLYVVDDKESVTNELRQWREYLDSRCAIINEDSKQGYDLKSCVPEVIRAYCTEGKFSKDSYTPLPYLETVNEQVWSTDRISQTSREGLVLHLWVDFLRKDYEQSKSGESGKKRNLKRIFDRFTGKPNVLTTPDAGLNKDGKMTGVILQMKDTRIRYSSEEEVEPRETLASIDEETKRRITATESESKKTLDTAVNRKLSEYRNTELPGILDKYEQDQKGPVTVRVSAEFNKRKEAARNKMTTELGDLRNNLDKIEKKMEQDSEAYKKEKDKEKKKKLENTVKKSREEVEKIRAEIGKLELRELGLDKEYDPSDAIRMELTRVVAVYKDETVEDERLRVIKQLSPGFEKELADRINTIKAEDRTKRAEAMENETVSRFHVYYELTVPDNESIESYRKSIGKMMTTGLSLRKDFTGDLVVLKRQMDALNALEEGYVMNPFLATALFSPASSGDPRPSIDVKFFQENLNATQKEAIRRALSSNGMFLIQGPPGTGKTQVIAELSTQIAVSGKKVLIASENNKAVDNAFGRIPKIPACRLMRVLSKDAKTKDVQFTQEKLLSNFYNNISSNLEKEVQKYEHRTKYFDELEEGIESLKQTLDRIKKLRDNTGSIADEIADLETEIDRECRIRNTREGNNADIENKISELETQKREIRSFEDADFAKRIENRIGVLGIVLGNDAADVIKALSNANRKSILDEFMALDDYKEYFDLKAQKAQTTTPKEIQILNTEIKKYCDEHDFDESEKFPFLKMLESIPENKILLEAKDLIDEEMTSALSKIDGQISGYKDARQDISGINRRIEELRNQIAEKKKDSSYSALENTESLFNEKARTLYDKLNLDSMFTAPENAIETLEFEMSRAKAEISGDQTENKQKNEAYRRIIKYLRDDSIVAQDELRYNSEILKTVNIFGMTCTSTDSFSDGENRVRLNELGIDVVILDEVSKISFIELLQPILYGKTVIMVGDHKQLAPIYSGKIDDDEISRYEHLYLDGKRCITEEGERKFKEMYEKSLFEDLFKRTPESNKITLTEQYRMHPDIMDVDNAFYSGKLTFGGKREFREHYLKIPGTLNRNIIDTDIHVIFVDCKGSETQDSGSTSYHNNSEAKVVRTLLKVINDYCQKDREGNPLKSEYNGNDDKRLSVGVICAYAEQAKLIRSQKTKRYASFNETPDEKFMVKTVDDFQGDERDIIILSTVRTKESKFLKDFHRINVAISRARRLLVIVGNRATLEKMTVIIDGRSTKAYADIIRTIERKGKVLEMREITGDE